MSGGRQPQEGFIEWGRARIPTKEVRSLERLQRGLEAEASRTRAAQVKEREVEGV